MQVHIPLIAFPTKGELVPEPLGVVLIFSSWNFPLGELVMLSLSCWFGFYEDLMINRYPILLYTPYIFIGLDMAMLGRACQAMLAHHIQL